MLGLKPLLDAVMSGGLLVVTHNPGNEEGSVVLRTLIDLNGDVVTSVSSVAAAEACMALHTAHIQAAIADLKAAALRLRVAVSSLLPILALSLTEFSNLAQTAAETLLATLLSVAASELLIRLTPVGRWLGGCALRPLVRRLHQQSENIAEDASLF